MLVSWQSDADAADTKSEHPVKSPAAYAATAHHQHHNANAATAADTKSEHPVKSPAAYAATVELSENEQLAETLAIPKRASNTSSPTDWPRNASESRIVTSVWRTM